MYKLGQSGGFSGRLLRPLIKTRLSLMKNVLKTLAKIVSIPLELTAAAAATDAAILKKVFGYDCSSDLASCATTLIFWNEEMNDIIKRVNSLEESGSLIKGVSETIKNEGKEQKRGFIGMLLGILAAHFLGNLSTGKRTIKGNEGILRAGQNFYATSSFNMFWNTKVLSNESKFNGVYSRNNLPKIKDGAYVTNLDSSNQ